MCPDGTCFIKSGKVDETLLARDPIGVLSGEWLVQTEYEKAKKDGNPC